MYMFKVGDRVFADGRNGGAATGNGTVVEHLGHGLAHVRMDRCDLLYIYNVEDLEPPHAYEPGTYDQRVPIERNFGDGH